MDKKTEKENELESNEEIVSENQSEETEAEFAANETEQEGMTEEQTQDNPQKKLEVELSATKDKYLRLYSEFENFRRRTTKEKIEMIQTASEQLVNALLPVLDDFERAAKSMDKDSANVEGFNLIHSKFKKILEQSGVKPMDIPVGSDFNPDTQEAITQIPAPEEKLKGKVVDVVEKGYLLNEKVIRYAKVVVGN